MPETDILRQALDRFKLAADAEQQQRKREKEDLQFQVPELQWPSEVQQQRAAQTVAGVPIPARPMLSIPKLDQPIQLVLNQEKAAQLGVQVHAISEDADDDTAEVLQGLYRRIEVDSRANLARSWGFERATKAGRGAYRVLTEYDPTAPTGSKDQRIVIKRLLRQESAYFDPFAQEPDWSDGEWAFVTEWMQLSKYKRQFKDTALADVDEHGLLELAESAPGWVTGEGEGRAVLIAEYFAVEGEGDARKIIWRKINAVEVLDEQEWPGQFIPIIPVIGRELIPFEGERRWVGIIGPNKDAQRLFNYSASAAVEMAALETKAPYVMVEGQDEGHESEWQQANIRSFPYLRYANVSLNGTPAPPPQRTQIDTSRLGPSMMLLQTAGDFIHAGTGAFEPSLGQSSPNAKTKGGTLALQQQHDQGNSNWLDNLAEISLTYEAKVVLDLICGDKAKNRAGIYDRPGRIARILDLEDNSRLVMLNQPFTLDPQTKRPVAAPAMTPGPSAMMGGTPAAQPQGEVKHYDLTQGAYGITVSIGKAYKSRVEQGADELGQLFQAEPQLFQILGDIYLKFRDFPGHMEAAERVKKMLPPPLQDQKDAASAASQIPQLQAQIQQLTQQLQGAAEFVKTEQAKHQAQVQIAGIKAEADKSIAHINNAAKIEVARITAAKEAIDADAAAQEEVLATGLQHSFDAHQANLDRAHQVGIASAGAGQASAQSEQEHQQGLAAGDQAHEQALEQGDAATQGQLAVQAAAPQPEQGGANA